MRRVTFESLVKFASRNGIAFRLLTDIDTTTVYFEVCDASDGYLSSQAWAIEYDHLNKMYGGRYTDVTVLPYRGWWHKKDERLLELTITALNDDRLNVFNHTQLFHDSYDAKWFGGDE